MYRIQAPGRYVQGPGILSEAGKTIREIGKNVLILAGRTAYRDLRQTVERSFAHAGIVCHIVAFEGSSTAQEADRVAALISELGCDAVAGMGGGQGIDTAKAAACRAGCPVVVIPTAASSDAPCSSLAILYDASGAVSEVRLLPSNPALVLVDSEVIAKAPPRLLSDGMGDALSTFFESRVCFENGLPNALGSGVSLTGFALARLCYETLARDGAAALEAVRNRTVTPALEHVIEANTYLSGVGFESGGVSCAHSVQDALAALPECHRVSHGARVAFGTRCLLEAERRPRAEIDAVTDFCAMADLPLTLEEVGLTEHIPEKLARILPIAFDPHHPACRMPPGLDAPALLAAILETDRRGRRYRAEHGEGEIENSSVGEGDSSGKTGRSGSFR